MHSNDPGAIADAIWHEADIRCPPEPRTERDDDGTGERALTATMRVERDWQSGAPTVMAPEFDEGGAAG